MNLKRKAETDADDADEGGRPRYKPQTSSLLSQAKDPTFVIGLGRRHGAYLRKISALNDQFAKWVAQKVLQAQGNVACAGLGAGAEDYLKHLESIQGDFKDVLDTQGKAGSLMMFGTGDMCQLGFGDEVTERKRPYHLPIGKNAALAKLAAGGMHTLAVTTSGQLYTWGVNDEGGLGRDVKSSNDHISDGPPVPADAVPDGLPGLVLGLPRVLAVSAGDSHSVCLTDAGEVWAWGAFRDAGGLWAFQPGGVKVKQKPVKVLECSAFQSFIQIASGSDHILALSSKGEVFSWGCGERGRLGRLPEAETSREHAQKLLTPAVIPKLQGVHAIACGAFSSFAITFSGDVYGWGLNNYGQLGWDVPTEKGKAGDGFFEPRLVESLQGRVIAQISSGEHHTLALTDDGTMLSFGRPTYGRLGREDVDSESDDPCDVPGVVSGFDGKVVMVDAGVGVSAAITDKGSLYMWGYGETCQLGNGSETDERLPVKVKQSKHFSGNTAIQVCVGGQHCALLAKE